MNQDAMVDALNAENGYNMKPQLLCKDNPNLDTLHYPVWVLPKLDGIRCVVDDGVPLSRTLKRIPNKHVQAEFAKYPYLHGADGELIVGDVTSKSVYRDTNSFVMAHDKVGEFKYYIFDVWSSERAYYHRAYQLDEWIRQEKLPNFCEVVGRHLCFTPEEVLQWEEIFLDAGYEGIIIRNPNGMYKFGRTTMKEQNAYKFKRYIDDEAVIVRAEPEYENTNEAFTNELGRTARSVEMAGLKAKNSLGALIVSHDTFGMFSIGTGFDAQQRKDLWELHQKEGLHNLVVKFKYFPVGIKDKPRHPVFLGFRDMEIDG